MPEDETTESQPKRKSYLWVWGLGVWVLASVMLASAASQIPSDARPTYSSGESVLGALRLALVGYVVGLVMIIISIAVNASKQSGVQSETLKDIAKKPGRYTG